MDKKSDWLKDIILYKFIYQSLSIISLVGISIFMFFPIVVFEIVDRIKKLVKNGKT